MVLSLEACYSQQSSCMLRHWQCLLILWLNWLRVPKGNLDGSDVDEGESEQEKPFSGLRVRSDCRSSLFRVELSSLAWLDEPLYASRTTVRSALQLSSRRVL